jgi:hypothetical protein
MRVIKNTRKEFILCVDKEELNLIVDGLSRYEDYLNQTLISYDEEGNPEKKECLFPEVLEKVRKMKTLLFHVERNKVPIGAYSLEDAEKFTLDFPPNHYLAKRRKPILRSSE